MSTALTLYQEYGDWAVRPRGYAGRAIQHLLRAGLRVRVIDRRLRLPEKDFAFRGELLPYQRRALDGVRGSSILVALPGRGKTVIGMAVIAAVRQPTLWVTHISDLVRQAAERAAEFLGLDPGEMGFVGDGTWGVGEKLTAALVQTLLSRLDETKALAKRAGLADGLWPFAEATMGPALCRIMAAKLESAGRLGRPRLLWVVTRFGAPFDGDWHARMDALTTDVERNQGPDGSLRGWYVDYGDGVQAVVSGLAERTRRVAGRLSPFA